MALTSHQHLEVPEQSNAAACTTPSTPIRTAARSTGTPEEIARKSAEDIRDLIRYSTPGKVAAFIAEPIQGVGGATHGAPKYLREVYAVVREHGGLCIADEVQTGFGRTGEHYWGFQNFGRGARPRDDGQGDRQRRAARRGHARGARSPQAMTQRIHFNTFGGNPVSMAPGLAVLDVIDEDGLQENCPRRRRPAQGRACRNCRRATASSATSAGWD